MSKELVTVRTAIQVDYDDNLPTVDVLIREGKSITLKQAEIDLYDFADTHNMDISIHSNAWTDTRLGKQRISAYDIYDLLDQLKSEVRVRRARHAQKLIEGNNTELLE
jgi:hypothetical protein